MNIHLVTIPKFDGVLFVWDAFWKNTGESLQDERLHTPRH